MVSIIPEKACWTHSRTVEWSEPLAVILNAAHQTGDADSFEAYRLPSSASESSLECSGTPPRALCSLT